jgi:hypothetical protein
MKEAEPTSQLCVFKQRKKNVKLRIDGKSDTTSQIYAVQQDTATQCQRLQGIRNTCYIETLKGTSSKSVPQIYDELQYLSSSPN